MRLNLVKSTADPVADFVSYPLPFNEGGEVVFTIYRAGIKPFLQAERKRQRKLVSATLPLAKKAEAALKKLNAPEAPTEDVLGGLGDLEAGEVEMVMDLLQAEGSLTDEPNAYLLVKHIEGLVDEDTLQQVVFTEDIARLACEEPFVAGFVREKARELQERYDAFIERARGNSGRTSDGRGEGTALSILSTESASNEGPTSGD